jgi:transglutaminase-like putative cysteine protease
MPSFQRRLAALPFLVVLIASRAGGEEAPVVKPDTAVAVFRIHHALTVKDLPAGAKKVRVWFWLPDDDDAQKVLDLTVQAPPGYSITRDAANGHHYLYAEVDAPGESLNLATDFILRRKAVAVPLDPEKAGAITDGHRTAFAEYLRRDCPNMEVNERITKLAEEICGNETNVVKQARALYDHVAGTTDHYNKPGAPKSSGKGSAEYCLDSKGGGCTDQHALFIALARARGIPTRLQFGCLLKVPNEGKEVDPGYRCWVQFFAPNYGWVPLDASAGNLNPDRRDFYFGGLDERRVRFLEGRDLDLTPRQTAPKLNLMIGAYVEVDGQPHKAFQRVMKYNQVTVED